MAASFTQMLLSPGSSVALRLLIYISVVSLVFLSEIQLLVTTLCYNKACLRQNTSNYNYSSLRLKKKNNKEHSHRCSVASASLVLLFKADDYKLLTQMKFKHFYTLHFYSNCVNSIR